MPIVKRIPAGELDFSFSRSSGAGGQNVNKVNTKVSLRWNINKSSSLPKTAKDRFYKKFKRRISDGGVVILHSQRYRSQARNIADCIEKLHEMIEAIAKPPKKRVGTKPTRSSIEKRIKTKKSKSETKKTRQKVRY
ncbi:MAG: aminoacyl-tRNA hydrolase [Halobacteriovorax sp.]|nr:aminoacyl-tRNA hydrolase [Halobacteriovorax sp.]|tara:strand:- start:261286 stop:261693 length:408 start_codon:yes stop_codon:yes gene_type:complete